MAARKPRKPRKDDITVVGVLILEDGSTVPFAEATPEQKERFYTNAAERASKGLSEYFSYHPEEYQKLKSLE